MELRKASDDGDGYVESVVVWRIVYERLEAKRFNKTISASQERLDEPPSQDTSDVFNKSQNVFK